MHILQLISRSGLDNCIANKRILFVRHIVSYTQQLYRRASFFVWFNYSILSFASESANILIAFASHELVRYAINRIQLRFQ